MIKEEKYEFPLTAKEIKIMNAYMQEGTLWNNLVSVKSSYVPPGSNECTFHGSTKIIVSINEWARQQLEQSGVSLEEINKYISEKFKTALGL